MSNRRTMTFAQHASRSWHGISLAIALVLGVVAPASAQTALGTAQQFGVLGASTVTNTGPTTIDRSLGVYSGLAITGLSSITVGGSVHLGDAVAQQAQSDARTAYTALGLLPFTTDLSGQNLGGMTLTPGVYFFSSTAQLTGNLFLDFLGSAGSTFVFQIGSALTTASGSTVSALNGGPFADVFWLVGSSATLGTGSTFQGTIIADQSISILSGARITCGRAIAMVGQVSMDTNVISSDDCASAAVPVTATPEPATLGLLAFGCVALFGVVRRRGVVARLATV
ncbi:MAG: ice-binding family protein [Gemmatimonadaceae bacterium]